MSKPRETNDMMKKYYIYYRQYEIMRTVVILGLNPIDACCRARKNGKLKNSTTLTYYVNESGTTEKERLSNFVTVRTEQIKNYNC